MAEKYEVIIIDDEESARNILGRLIEQFHPELKVVASCEELPQAVPKIKKHKPDLVFLDIEMPLFAGYEITSFFDTIDFEIIFITAYDHYAVKAFEVAAVDYLLKPIEIERLQSSIQRFKNKAKQKNEALNYKVLQESLANSQLLNLIVPTKNGQKSIAIESIICIEAHEAYSKIIVNNGEHFMMSKNLKYFETLFENNHHFFRSHKSWIINKNHIDHFSFSDLLITMKNGLTPKLSKYKKADFQQFMS